MIDDVLTMSRIEAGRLVIDRRDVVVDAAVAEAVALIGERASAKKHVVEVEQLPGALIRVDPHSLRQILLALLENAVKFTPECGRVSLRPRIVGDGVNIYVEDTGIGIPREALAKVVRPFEQVEHPVVKRYGGSGLGLAMARSLARLNGGSMRIRSIEGSGTIVMVRLPKAA
jgi:two-component system cell cycle sensor histidine kinase PleC